MNDKRTAQERDPHPRLVEARNQIQTASKCSRTEAARLANQLSHRDVDAILSAKNEAEVKKIAGRVAEKALPEEGSHEPAEG